MKKEVNYIDRGTTLFLRAAVLGVSLMVLVFWTVMLVGVYQDWGREFPDLAYWRYPVIAVMSSALAAFFVAVVQILKLVHLVDNNKAFTSASVRTMKNVEYCGLLIGGLFATLLPLVYSITQKDDAPGLILIFTIIFVGVPVIVGVFAAVAQRLFQNAIDIKKENDLTV